MPPKSAREIDQVLGDLPLMDRIVALMCSIIMRKLEVTKGVVSMIAIVTAMAEHLDEPTRIGISEVLRDAADAVERQQLERV
jgi:hypothetical protein